MSTIRFLRTFLAIEKFGSMSAAADHVRLTQAAVGQQMRALEAELRRPLFDRSGRGTRMTAAGRALVPHARKIVSIYEEMLSTRPDTSELTGTVTVGAIVSATGFLCKAALNLKDRHPALELKLLLGHDLDLCERVKAGEVDAAVVEQRENINDRPGVWTPLYVEPLIMLANSKAASRNASAEGLLESQPFIRYDRSTGIGREIERILQKMHIKPKEILEVNAIGTIMDLVRQNVGVSIIPQLKQVAWDREKSLTVLPLLGSTSGRVIGIYESLKQPKNVAAVKRQILHELG
ncbi:LysR family transcriptional regulator [Burkholderia sp. Ac-20365]|uniref:LysR family transcriptional regulator n=1 Tax=Burkholderia sp. Ac-20365 TaxID=2703897 RepID=UPI00197CADB1|nr:LysR family transcriptional regulator [Burkholderia sp. Ac-20365]MBN3761664.1 LysR family transcriptional regulator [Burkholderia sp. Ac-20365]